MRTPRLIEREVDTLTFPDRMYMCGGGGIRMGLEIFNKDWVQIEAMRGRDTRLKVHFLDTATKEQDDIVSEVTDLRERAHELEQQIHDDPNVTTASSIQFDPNYVTDNIRVNTRGQIVGDNLIDRVKQNTDADYWWLQEDHIINPDTPGNLYDFSQGAIRQRAVGKAFHYKALTEDSDYRQMFTLKGGDSRVAIFAGLGGGTGSGVFIDIARYIDENNPASEIILFATLPDLGETNNEKANGFAALSELERLRLDSEEESPFTDIVLVPTDPTDHDGETTDEGLLELDDALTYALLGYYNNNGIDPVLTGTKQYAPFTLAIPQVLRYNVKTINTARDRTEETLEKKRQALNAEWQLYNDLIGYIDDNYPQISPEDSELNKRDIELLKDRVKQFRDLIEFDIFRELQFKFVQTGDDRDQDEGQGIEHLRIIFGDEYPNVSVDQLFDENSIEDIMGRIRMITRTAPYDPGIIEEASGLTDDLLRRIAYEDLERIRLLYQLRRERRRTLTVDDTVERLLDFYSNPRQGRGTRVQRLNNLDNKRRDVQNSYREKDQRAEKLQKEIEQEREEQRTKIEQQYDAWYEIVREDVETLVDLSEIDISEEVNTLTGALGNFAERIQTARNPDEVHANDIFDMLEAIEKSVRPIEAIDFQRERQDIEQSIEELRRLRKRWDELQEAASSESFMGRISNVFTSDSGPQAQDERDAYRGVKSGLERKDIFSGPAIPPNITEAEFIPSVTYDPADNRRILAQIDTTREEAKSAISETFLEDIRDLANDPNAGVEEMEELNTMMADIQYPQQFREDLMEHVKDAFADHLSDRIPKLREQLEEAKSELDELKMREERLESAEDVFFPLNETEKTFRENHESFVEDLHRGAEIFEVEQANRHSLSSLYINLLTPPDIGKALDRNSLAETTLIESESERRLVEELTKKMVSQRTFSSRYNGIRKSQLSEESENFRDTSISLGIFTEALDRAGDDTTLLHTNDFEFRDIISENFNLDEAAAGENLYFPYHVQNGGPWDIGLCLYIQGLPFLDNLREVGESGTGYEKAYQKKRESLEDERVRHVHALHDGYFVRRRTVVNLEDDPGRFIGNSKDVRDRILRFGERVTLPELVSDPADTTETTPSEADESKTDSSAPTESDSETAAETTQDEDD